MALLVRLLVPVSADVICEGRIQPNITAALAETNKPMDDKLAYLEERR